ncbi:hypothetical protein A2U01_0019165, partial [Trifolium medium]|nr:hypothetical protein [Trifolium medium]
MFVAALLRVVLVSTIGLIFLHEGGKVPARMLALRRPSQYLKEELLFNEVCSSDLVRRFLQHGFPSFICCSDSIFVAPPFAVAPLFADSS